jgi:hypothetical protein
MTFRTYGANGDIFPRSYRYFVPTGLRLYPVSSINHMEVQLGQTLAEDINAVIR